MYKPVFNNFSIGFFECNSSYKTVKIYQNYEDNENRQKFLKNHNFQGFHWISKLSIKVKFFAGPDSTSFVASKCSVIMQISYDLIFPQETKKHQKLQKTLVFGKNS